MERTVSVIDVLLPRTKQHLLSALLLQPARSWYLNELARELQVRPSSLQRELTQFVSAGIIARRKDGNRVYFRADRTCPVYPELSQLLAKTVGLADVIREALSPLRATIELAFIYGSVASHQERSSSDVDLMIVGDATLADLAVPLRSLESRLGRTVNSTVYTGSEFGRRVSEKHHFLTSVLGTDLLMIFGTADDLARLAKRAENSDSPDKSARDSRSSRRRPARPR